MFCKHCHIDSVSWVGNLLMGAYTRCSECGRFDCQVPPETLTAKDGELVCDHCYGHLEVNRDKHPCQCAVSNPPCSNCVDAPFECVECSAMFDCDLVAME